MLGMYVSACGPTPAPAPGGPVIPYPNTGSGTPGSGTNQGSSATPPAPPTTPLSLPECPTAPPSTTPIGTPTSGGGYDRQKAVEFALKYKNIADFKADGYPVPDPSNNCTNFISYALSAGGIQHTNVWKPGENDWQRTPDLFGYLQSVGFVENSQPFFNTPDVGAGGSNNLQLRANNQYTRQNIQLVKNLWTDFIADNQNIQPGDLAFIYDATGGQTWSHVEIVTGWGDETTWDSRIQNGIREPLVVDHSGRPLITPDKLPRSVGDTAGVGNREVVFLRAP